MSEEPSDKMKAFLTLARVLRESRDRCYVQPVAQEDALEEADEFMTMLQSNLSDGDSVAARIENAAGLLHATLKFADLLMLNMSLTEIERSIEENRESEVEE